MKILGWLSVLLLSALVVLTTAPRQLGVSMVTPFAQIVAFRGALLVASAAGALLVGAIWLAVLVRTVRKARTGHASVAGVVMLSVLLVVLIGSTLGHGMVMRSRGLQTTARGTIDQIAAWPIQDADFTVVSINTQWDSVSPEWIAQLAVAASAKMIALPESEEPHARAVAAALAAKGQPGWQVFATTSPWPNAMLISPSAGAYRLVPQTNQETGRGLIVAEPVGHQGPTLVTVHAMPPPLTAPWNPNHKFLDMWWQRTVQGASDLIRSTPHIVAAGDFNATVDHAALDPGVYPAVVGGNAWGTWPSSAPAWLGAPIDHVYAKPYPAVRGAWVVDAPGSDHRALVVRLTMGR